MPEYRLHVCVDSRASSPPVITAKIKNYHALVLQLVLGLRMKPISRDMAAETKIIS